MYLYIILKMSFYFVTEPFSKAIFYLDFFVKYYQKIKGEAIMSTGNNVTNHDLLIYQKYLELVYYTTNILVKFPRSEKFALATEIRDNLYSGLSHLIRAIKLFNKRDKLDNLFEFDVSLSILKVQIRLANKNHYISEKNYTFWSQSVTDIGNMLGGWIASCQKR